MQMFSLFVGLCLAFTAAADNFPFPYGFSVGDQPIGQGDDFCSPALMTNTDLVFPGTIDTFEYAYICSNGLVCFDSYTPSCCPSDNGGQRAAGLNCFAPFWADLTSYGLEETVYQQYHNLDVPCLVQTHDLGKNITALVSETYCVPNYTPKYALIVTWVDAKVFAYDDGRANIQFLYTTDGVAGFAFYFYKDGGMVMKPEQNMFIGLIQDGLLTGTDDDMRDIRTPDQSEILTSQCPRCEGVELHRGAWSYGFGNYAQTPGSCNQNNQNNGSN